MEVPPRLTSTITQAVAVAGVLEQVHSMVVLGPVVVAAAEVESAVPSMVALGALVEMALVL
jgi:hypothetical protein